MIRSSLSTIALVLVMAAPALAAQPGQPAADADRGKRLVDAIDKVKLKAAKLDANKDGWLSDEETVGGRDKLGALYGPIERRVDADNDGRVSVNEYVGAQVKALEAADVNKDGWLTRDEARAHKRRLVMELLSG